jgi:hypothetical protein
MCSKEKELKRKMSENSRLRKKQVSPQFLVQCLFVGEIHLEGGNSKEIFSISIFDIEVILDVIEKDVKVLTSKSEAIYIGSSVIPLHRMNPKLFIAFTTSKFFDIHSHVGAGHPTTTQMNGIYFLVTIEASRLFSIY